MAPPHPAMATAMCTEPGVASPISRRRLIGITAAAAGLSLLPFAATATAEAHLVTWRGTAMGALASLQVHHRDRAAAEQLLERCLAEVRRLERIFSLYRDDSALVALNRHRVLVGPPPELVNLLEECRRFWTITGGVFDPTVQVLWNLYRDHFAAPGSRPEGPKGEAVEAALAKVGFQHVAFDRNRIALRQGAGLTLNGAAQGFVTDRVVAVLRAGGIERSLVDMGESRALGTHPEGRPWQVAIADPDEPDGAGETLAITDQAVATSGGYGFRFDAAGRFNHLFDPATGRSADAYKSVTVVMPTATAADALSTAFSLMPVVRIKTALRTLGNGRVIIQTTGGRRSIFL